MVGLRGSLTRAVVWVVASILFLDVAWGRVAQLRAAGRYVSPWRYANVGFWVVMVGFWGWNAWAGYRKLRAERA